jgi:endonuclease YncB( thermonuclease family)
MALRNGLIAVLLAGLVASWGVGGAGLFASISAESGDSKEDRPSKAQGNANAKPGRGNEDRFQKASGGASASTGIMINEIELNPLGRDADSQWVELYNPAASDVAIGGFKIKSLLRSNTVEIPSGAVIGAGQFYVVVIDGEKLTNRDAVALLDDSGQTINRTPSLLDRNDDARTWQRMPDGSSTWRLAQGTQGSANDPSTYQSAPSEPPGAQRAETAAAGSQCSGSAMCAEGIVIRVADADTLYVKIGSDTYKVDLSLTKAPGKGDRASSFTRDLCLGSSVLVDQDDGQAKKGRNITAAVYCSLHNLNQELLDGGYAQLDRKQCPVSEFSGQDWARRNGCE